MIKLLIVTCSCLFASGSLSFAADASLFSTGWRFLRADAPGASDSSFDDTKWESVTLPHTARIEVLPAGKNAPQWQGICWYRKRFPVPRNVATKVVLLRFEGAMNVAEIWVNGKSAGKFMGGYLPYMMDISPLLKPGKGNVVAVRLDNRDNPITGPKPLADLDFNLYGGLYRDARLIIKDKLHITDPILADKVAGGGVFVTFPEVSKDSALVSIKTHIKNADTKNRSFAVINTLLDAAGKLVATIETKGNSLDPSGDSHIQQRIRFPNPKLWSPNSPYLYRVRTELISNGSRVDQEETRIGIRRIEITPDGFWINGEKMFLRGCNRHQEYPYIGNALSDAAQYRDALKIKEAGFDYVRLSHYPQATAFLDACDELGLVVMNCLMGWQYFGKDPAFAELKYHECRHLVRRDRNHPSVILWEVSLNESDMPRSFVETTHKIAHEEYPGDQCYTCGWTRGYDVFIQARQHGGCKKAEGIACLVSEYGDWEYYAQNAGLEQHKWKDLKPAERSSRQLRGDGEIRLLQQALNFQEAHNDNLKTTAFADGLWVMYDYSRGYAEDIESSGVMDVFRLPKFSYWFYKSQREPDEQVNGRAAGPMVFIANYWTHESPLDVRVFSNCEEVALYLNGKLLERRRPDTDRVSDRLRNPPFTFKLAAFEPGELRAVGHIDGREAASHQRRTPGKPDQLTVRVDLSDRPFALSGKDAVFCYAEVLDENGVVVPGASMPVSFGAAAVDRLIGSPASAEAGVASVLVETDGLNPAAAVYALCIVQDKEEIRVLSVSASSNKKHAPDYKVVYTVDGSEPTNASPEYRGPITNAARVRAAIIAKSKIVARAESLPNP